VLSGGGAKGFAHIGALQVLVDAGVPIDYVGGTSMGGIMGGLLAAGYHPDSLEKLVLGQNWDELLAGVLSRRNLSMAEKEESEKFFFSLPFKEKKILLPEGLVAGQSVYDVLSYFASPGYAIRNFQELEIPFLCVAADIETGEYVTLKNGYLPDALRATMAIPTVFSPIEIDGKLLVDGGLVNNYPAEEVKNMGADIIIGVDVSDPLKTRDELSSLIKILDQTTSFLRKPLHEKNIKMTDVLIKPELKGYGVSSFNAADTLIARGKAAAEKMLPDVLRLLDSIGVLVNNDVQYKLQAQPLDSILINEIVIEGIQQVSPNFVESVLQLEVVKYHSMEKIFEAIKKLYGTQNFEHIRYRFDPLERGGYRFAINLKEKVGGEFRVGLHYDSDFKASFLLNLTFRNVWLSNGRLLFDLALGDNNSFRANYLFDRGWKPGFGIQLEAENFKTYVFEDDFRVGSFDFSNALFTAYSQSNISDFTVILGGVQMEYSSLSPDVFLIDFENYYEYNTNFIGAVLMDNLDRLNYPKRGFRFQSQFKLITDVEDSINNPVAPTAFLSARYMGAINLHPRLTLVPKVYFGTILSRGEAVLPQYQMYLGGLRDGDMNGIFPFVGLEFMQLNDLNALIGRIDVQYEFMKNFYAIPKWNVGFRSGYLDDIFTEHRMINGYGLTLGVSTPLGPIEVTIMSSDYTNDVNGYFRLGYNF
jgi:NTE family protein